MVCVSFEQFLEAVTDWIPGKRLRKRIRKELGDHMEDMLAEKTEAGADEEIAKKQVLSEMGDPEVLRKDFIRAHIAEIRVTRLGILLTLAVLLFCALYFLPPVFEEFKTYLTADTLEEAEQELAALYADGAPITFIGEATYDGRRYRFYTKENDSENFQYVFSFSSIRFFGKAVPDRFSNYHARMQNGEGPIGINLFSMEFNGHFTGGFGTWRIDPETSSLPQNEVYIFLKKTDAAYLQVSFFQGKLGRDILSEEESTESGLIPVPEAPCMVQVDVPSGRIAWNQRYYDKDKNEIQLEHASVYGTAAY